MTGAVTWHGRKGSVLLGPTEARIARYLDHATRHGRIAIRTVDLARDTQLERSEAYRITARLRALGLFGVENDRGATKGGRRYWRTPVEHDGQMLNAERHRAAWSRIVAWARARRGLLHDRLARVRGAHHLRQAVDHRARLATPRPVTSPLLPGRGGTFMDRMRRYGLGPLLDEWAQPRIAR